jgi:hypothetical protein
MASTPPGGVHSQQEFRLPVPDPTTLTTDQLRREISALREILETRFVAVDKLLDSMQRNLDRRHEDIVDVVGNLRTLHEEKFHSIQVQFSERDTRTEQTSRDSKVAVDAALQAAKEAVGEQNKSSALAIAKSEAATTKQIDQIGVILSATAGGLNDKIEDIKDRLTRQEGASKGASDLWGIILGTGGIVIAVSSFIVSLLLRTH